MWSWRYDHQMGRGREFPSNGQPKSCVLNESIYHGPFIQFPSPLPPPDKDYDFYLSIYLFSSPLSHILFCLSMLLITLRGGLQQPLKKHVLVTDGLGSRQKELFLFSRICCCCSSRRIQLCLCLICLLFDTGLVCASSWGGFCTEQEHLASRTDKGVEFA
ncbi:hypothetical protein BO78DRAFT_137314 [Aspergillus sclerotiicarbonarius CBS 121057]|uniref:Uncharacterized protein n=1 Tax=Aspergillus sclerotiicarbonarius (strain CBS 121057 / IBT 28362) TaxID=1448318 RepID=A0A319EH59_ASPSB|nr:hypothetical protein BO78DRAFT_137314 [Aspergillus sclerotiicarbonarius CBS 121057]